MLDTRDSARTATKNRTATTTKATGSRSGNRKLQKSSVPAKGLTFERVFSTAGVNPFDQVEWEKRKASITDDKGKVIFEQKDIEVPKSGRCWPPTWSPRSISTATQQVRARVLRAPARPPRGPHHHRLGPADGYFATKSRRRDLLRGADLPLPEPVRRLQLARSGSTAACISTASARKAAPATFIRTRDQPSSSAHPVRISPVLGLLHPVGRRHDGQHHGARPAARRCCSSSAAARAPTCRPSAAAARR
jgi:hypothetical protein